jgi:hypothetical protein
VGTHVLKLTHEHNSIKNVGTHVLKLTHEHLLVSCSARLDGIHGLWVKLYQPCRV